MFVRFRKTPRRLQVSIIETRRTGRKVASEHVAGLGSVTMPMTVRGRQAFWTYLWERLATLSNRVGAEDQARIRNAVHARIPMVMPDEAAADEAKYWDDARKSFEEIGAGQREVAALAVGAAEQQEAIAAVFAGNRAAALKGEKTMDRDAVLQVQMLTLGGFGLKPEDCLPDTQSVILASQK